MIKKGELKKQLNERLAKSLAEFGFISKRGSFIKFIKQLDDIRFTYSIDLLKWSYGIEINPYAHITFIKTEEYINRVLQQKEQQYTIGNDIGEIKHSINNRRVRNSELRFTIENESQLDDAHSFLLKCFKEVAMPYFNNNTNIDKVERLINGEPNEVNNVHAAFNPGRMFIGVVLAKFCHRPDFDELLDIYKSSYETVNPSIKSGFDQLIAFIEKDTHC